jgi:capsular exopolysaccharide synthesis family protein
MDLRDYLRVLRKRWGAVAVCMLLGIGAAAALVYETTPKYEASTQLFVAAQDTGGVATGLQSGDQFSQDRVKSYADIISSPLVTDPVAKQAGDGLSAQQVANEITADAPANTVLVNVHVTDTSARRAQALANAVSQQFVSYVAALETTPGASASPVKLTVVKRAQLPTAPVSPKTALDLVLGLLIGLAVGISVAVLRETLDRTVKDPIAVQNALELPLLGAIAFDPDARKSPLIVHAHPRSTRAEAFRQLRTNLQFVDIDNAPRSIVVTSSIPEEGKTTTTTNLAITLAQSGLRVVLVEGDLRRPRMAGYLGIEGAVGLTSVLVGRANLADAIQGWGPGGALGVLPSGPVPPNPSELLGSQGMVDLLRELERSYDLVLIDAPPLLPVTDAAVLSTIASGAVVIVRHGSTRIDQLARAVESLRTVDSHIYGLVFTMTPTKGPDAYYYYGESYRYESKTGKSDLVRPDPRTSRRRKGDKSPAAPAAGARTAPSSGTTVLPGISSVPAPNGRPPEPARARSENARDSSDALTYFDS